MATAAWDAVGCRWCFASLLTLPGTRTPPLFIACVLVEILQQIWAVLLRCLLFVFAVGACTQVFVFYVLSGCCAIALGVSFLFRRRYVFGKEAATTR